MLQEMTQADYRDVLAARKPAGASSSRTLPPLRQHGEGPGKIRPPPARRRAAGLDIQKNPDAAAALGANGRPPCPSSGTGAIIRKKTGLLNPKELLALYQEA